MSHQAEQAVLHAILADSSKLRGCDLEPIEFHSWHHQEIYTEAKQIVKDGGVVDIVTLLDGLTSRTGQNFAQYIKQLYDDIPSSATAFDDHCKLIRRDYRKTQAIGIATDLRSSLEDGSGMDSVDRAIRDLMALNQLGRNYDWSMREVMRDAVQQIENARAAGGMTGITTGLPQLDDALGGFHDTDLIVVPARPAMGKAQPLSSKILLSDGSFKAMGSIEIGDSLASVDGGESKVTGIFPQGVRPIYEIELSDGRTVECDLEHLWSIESSKFDGVRTVTTADLIGMLEKERYQNRIRFVTHDGNFGEKADLNIDPWLLGFLIGDGCLNGSSVRFSTGEPFIVHKVLSRLPPKCSVRYIGNYDYRIVSSGSSNPILDEIGRLELGVLSYDKKIPDLILKSDRDTRLGVLLGLIESDGWSQVGSLQFSTSSLSLSEGVRALVHSLGGCATYRLKTNVKYVANGERVAARDAHICSITFDSMLDEIESDRVKRNIAGRKKTSKPIIRNIRYLRRDFAQCITVSHPKKLYITDGYIVTHNTALLLNFALSANTEAGIISGEQARAQVGQRFISIDGKLDSHGLRSAELSEEEWPQLTASVTRLSERKIRVYDQSAPSINTIARVAREWKHRYGIKILFCDYLQKFRGSDRRMNRLQQVTEIAGELKNLARELEIPIVTLAQVNRQCENRDDKRPKMGDIADASEIEKEADQIIILYRDEVYNEDSEDKGVAELNIVKNRHGPIGMVPCVFVGRHMSFKPLDRRYSGGGFNA